MRLVDRIRLALGRGFPPAAACPAIIADQIAAQIDALPDSDRSPAAGEYGCVAPPFHDFFIEARTEVVVDEEIWTIERGLHFEVANAHLWEKAQPLYEGTHWIYSITPYQWRQRRLATGNLVEDNVPQSANGRLFLHLDAAGHLLDDMSRVHTAAHDSSPQTDAHIRQAVTFIPFALKAISALHQRIEAEHVTPTRQQQRQHGRKHAGRKLADYYVLKVRSPGSRQSPGSFAGVGVASGTGRRARREHVVRGHFRYYSPERPLFGRYSGMVWIGQHERGRGQGKISKDYLIDLGDK
jgi:hypothetical protein